MFSQVLGNLISFVQGSYKKKVDEIQAAVLLTGINMPDHIAQFTSLCKEIKKVVTPHVVTLQSQNCQNIKSFIENMVYAFVNETNEESEVSCISLTSFSLYLYSISYCYKMYLILE